MSDKNTVKFTLDPKRPTELTDSERAKLDAMTDDEIERAAQDDDCPPMDNSERNTYRRVPNVRAIRERLSMSQEQFAAAFGLSAATVRDWEQRRVFPNQAARAYLRVIAAIPSEVQSVFKAS